jgi:hypothetical protein
MAKAEMVVYSQAIAGMRASRGVIDIVTLDLITFELS